MRATSWTTRARDESGHKHRDPPPTRDEAPGSVAYLHSLGRGVVVVVVRLVVLVPVVTRLDTVEVARFSGAELVVPPVRLRKRSMAAIRTSQR